MKLMVDELCDSIGLEPNLLKLENVVMNKELEYWKEHSHEIFSCDKISKDGCYVLIIRTKKGGVVCYYFKSKSTSQDYLNKINYWINKKV